MIGAATLENEIQKPSFSHLRKSPNMHFICSIPFTFLQKYRRPFLCPAAARGPGAAEQGTGQRQTHRWKNNQALSFKQADKRSETGACAECRLRSRKRGKPKKRKMKTCKNAAEDYEAQVRQQKQTEKRKQKRRSRAENL